MQFEHATSHKHFIEGIDTGRTPPHPHTDTQTSQPVPQEKKASPVQKYRKLLEVFAIMHSHNKQLVRCSYFHFFLATFMYRTPQALHRVLGPWGPALHTGVDCRQEVEEGMSTGSN